MNKIQAYRPRYLTPEEKAEKIKDWPKATGETMQEQNARIQRSVNWADNYPPGITGFDIDYRLTK